MEVPELNSLSWLGLNTARADVCDIEPAQLRWGARNGRSSPLLSAGALEMAARTRSAPPRRSKLIDLAARKYCTCRRFRLRARSAPLGRSEWPLEPARLRWGARNGRSAPLGRSKRPLEPARLHWGAQNGRSNSLGSAKALEIARPGCSKILHLPTFAKSSPLGSAGPERLHWAEPRMPASLNIETNIPVHGMHGSALVYIYIYIYIYVKAKDGAIATDWGWAGFVELIGEFSSSNAKILPYD